MKSQILLQKSVIIESQTKKGKYKQGDTIKSETETIKSSLCDYSDAFILVTGNITVTADNDKNVAFKNCAPFSTCRTVINDVFADRADHIYIAMPMHNLIEYKDNYSDTSAATQFKRDEIPNNNADLAIDNSQWFKYKSALVGKTKDAVGNTNSSVEDAKIVIPSKYLSNFWKSLEMSLINCKVDLELNWIEDCILSSAGGSAILSTKDSANLAKQFSEGFKRYVYWNSYETNPAKVIAQGKNLYELLNVSFQGVKRLFVLAYAIDANRNDEA